MSRQTSGGRAIPALRYRDAVAAIDWLGAAFGFEPRLVVPGDDDGILHAQLVAGDVMVMLGTARDDGFGQMQKTPEDVGGIVTQSAYIVVDNPDAHYERAVSAGAEIVMEIADQDHGGRMYSCRDPEGHLWNFGSYDPWAED